MKIDTRNNYALFDGCRGHRVEQFSAGERYSLVFFSLNAWQKGPRDEMPEGTVYPTLESLKYFSDLLSPARGQGNSSILAAFGKPVRPQALFWPRANVTHLPQKLLALVAEYADAKHRLYNVNRVISEILWGQNQEARARE